MNAIAMIHVAKKNLGMHDDDYRALVKSVSATGQSSAKLLSPAEQQALIGKMKGLGFQPVARNGKLSGPYAPKLIALWLSAWNLGIVRNRHENALIEFVDRQTGISHVRWLRDARDAASVIEALKKWMTAKAGVVWPTSADASGRALKIAVIAAQHRLLGFEGAYRDNPDIRTDALNGVISGLGVQIRAKT